MHNARWNAGFKCKRLCILVVIKRTRKTYCSLSHEVCVEFSKDFGVGDLSSVEFTELPSGVGAPVVLAFGELLLSNIVDTDSDEVVVLNS